MKYLRVVVLCLLLLCLPGCWDYRRINDRAQVLGIGVDPVYGNSKVLSYTFQVPNLEEGGGNVSPGGGGNGGSGSGGEGNRGGAQSPAYRNFTVEAASLHTALAQAQTEYNKGFYLGNLQAIVLNTGLNKIDIQSVIEQLMRSESADKLAQISFSKESAQEILSLPTSTAPASVIESTLTVAMPQQGFVPHVRLWEFWRDAELTGLEAHATIVTSDSGNLKFDGTELFDRYSPVGEISTADNLYYNLVAHRIRRMPMTIPDGDKSFDIRAMGSTSKISVTMNHGVATLHDHITLTAELISSEDRDTRPVTNQELKKYESVTSRYLKAQSLRVLTELQSKGTDICGFGRWYFLHNPAQEQYIQTRWDDVFKHANTDMDVVVHVKRTGNLI
ncbi:Ger(x)C family spore germination protein [Alicyclobacillus suci]|uniref:Ger(x)C family spore germination protein n=1 Tax=Alicyclobacillus suci TaxID=2816080 RepID=UPI001A8C0AF1|nr:Ger(x)C family spore germination protein [Alicyclobacillus suci]